MEQSKATQVFIDTATLEELLKQKEAGSDIRILDCTAYATPEEGDPLLAHFTKRIPGAEHLDLRYLKDLSKPYPNMFP